MLWGTRSVYHGYVDVRTIIFACLLPVHRTGLPCKTKITLVSNCFGRSCDVKPMVVNGRAESAIGLLSCPIAQTSSATAMPKSESPTRGVKATLSLFEQIVNGGG